MTDESFEIWKEREGQYVLKWKKDKMLREIAELREAVYERGRKNESLNSENEHLKEENQKLKYKLDSYEGVLRPLSEFVYTRIEGRIKKIASEEAEEAISDFDESTYVKHGFNPDDL